MTLSQLQVNQPEDVKLFQQVIADYCQTWSTLPNSTEPDWNQVFALYAPLKGLMFFDAVTPHSFSTPDEMKAVFPPVAKLLLIPHDDLQVYRSGNVVWTTVNQDIEAIAHDGTTFTMTQRQTAIWQHHKERWVRFMSIFLSSLHSSSKINLKIETHQFLLYMLNFAKRLNP